MEHTPVEMDTFSHCLTQETPTAEARTRREDSISDLWRTLKDAPALTHAQLGAFCITADDFRVALGSVQPSAKREGFATVPDVTWDDVGALATVRKQLQMAILVSAGVMWILRQNRSALTSLMFCDVLMQAQKAVCVLMVINPNQSQRCFQKCCRRTNHSCVMLSCS